MVSHAVRVVFSVSSRFLRRCPQSSFQRNFVHGAPNDNSSSSSSSSESEENEQPNTSEVKFQILDASLKYVSDLGWTRKALAAGAESLGFPSVAQGMLHYGGAELVLYLNYSNNLKLEEFLKEYSSKNESSLSLSDYLFEALQKRLEMTLPFIDRWSEALALMASPQHITSDLELLNDLSNKIWFHYGDRNVDLKWYSRRLSLSAAYKFTEFSLIQDSSEDYVKTWNFLRRRVSNVVSSDDTITEVQSCCNVLPELSTSTFIIMRNILGMRRM